MHFLGDISRFIGMRKGTKAKKWQKPSSKKREVVKFPPALFVTEKYLSTSPNCENGRSPRFEMIFREDSHR